MTSYTITREGKQLVLAQVMSEKQVEVSTWDEGWDRLAFFRAQAVRGRHLESNGLTLVKVALVPHLGNKYNRKAVSVSIPGAQKYVRSRHLGYLRDHYLRNVGWDTIPDLAALANSFGGEVVCTGAFWEGRDDLTLLLPIRGEVVKRAAEELLIKHDMRKPEIMSVHTKPSQRTNNVLASIKEFKKPRRIFDALSVSTKVGFRSRYLQVTDGVNRKLIGIVESGYLLLEDERDRGEVLEVLRRLDVPVELPRNSGHFSSTALRYPIPPNLWASVSVDGVAIRSYAPGKDGKDGKDGKALTIAYYNPSSKKLWIEDSRLVDVVTLFASRLGLDVKNIGTPRTPWHLDSEVNWVDLKDYTRRHDADSLNGSANNLLEACQILIPPALLTGYINWVKVAKQAPHVETDVEFITYERHVFERQCLFGDHQMLEGSYGTCRLCGCRAINFTAAICESPIAYCHACLIKASTGVVQSRDKAAEALRIIGDIEYDGIPMVEEQLASLHINPQAPASSDHIDRLLLLRFAIARGRHPWTHLLEQAGFASDGLKLSRGTLIRARDGHLCLSLREKAVCDFLHQFGIQHEREPYYPIDPDCNPHGRRRADWLLKDGTLVELWGLPKDPKYAAKMVDKRHLAARHGLQLIELTDADIPKLPKKFAAWLPLGTNAVTVWKWSPAIDVTEPVQSRSKSSGGGRGRNESNINARKQRLLRCREAVDLQMQGCTHREISKQLGVGVETVRQLLRDGKFYVNPHSDSTRLRAAKAAADMMTAGATKTELQVSLSLSSAKSEEAWKDADVLFGALKNADFSAD